MKGPFGVLLVGGGLILLIGLFSGKITFPGANPPGTPPPPPKPAQYTVKQLDPSKPIQNTGSVPSGNTPAGTVLVCPPGQHPVRAGIRGTIACQAD